jgi:hypothetical protein
MKEEANDQRRCGLCGKSKRLTRTPCCGNWICDDEHEYVPFSYERNSCFRNHTMHTICGVHHFQEHQGRWQDCSECRERDPLELFVHLATNEYNFEKLENPPSFEPTYCSACGVPVRLSRDGYKMDSKGITCLACDEAQHPGQSEAIARAFRGLSGQEQIADRPDRARFTLETRPGGGMSVAEILEELSTPDATRAPAEALAAADAHKQDLLDPFLQALERGIAEPKSAPPGEAMLFSYACYLLAKWREPRAYPLIIRWLSLPGEDAFEIGGDTATEDGSRFLAAVCGGDLQPIKDLILNRDANEFCRSSAMEALAVLVAWKELPHQTVSDYFLWLAREGLVREYNFVWDTLAGSCADLEAIDVFPELRRAYDEGLIDQGSMKKAALDAIEAGPRGAEFARFSERRRPIEDVASEIAWWACFENDPGFNRDANWRDQQPALDLPAAYAQSAVISQPYRSPPKIGRNEPCPCGSGKKYKKCCGK